MSKHFSDKFAPVSRVLVSSKVGGDTDTEKHNADAVWQLHKNFKQIVNSNGELAFGLTDLENKIVKSADAYVFLPIPKKIKQLNARERLELFREMFKAASLHVGVQTNDPNLRLDPTSEDSAQKPIFFVNVDGCWDGFDDVREHLYKLGTISKDGIVRKVGSVEELIPELKKAHEDKAAKKATHPIRYNFKEEDILAGQQDPDELRKPDFNVCVFCSASTKDKTLIDSATRLGKGLAKQGWGVISGMGNESMMGAVVRGAADVIQREKKGWVAGSNLPRIFNMEGVPPYYDKLWMKPDIYTRMEVMIKNSEAFVIMPGGMGTVQELMALLLLRHSKAEEGKPYLMHGTFGNKPIVLVNHKVQTPEGEQKFWEPVVKLAKTYGFENDLIVVDTVQEAIDKLKAHHKQGKKIEIAA